MANPILKTYPRTLPKVSSERFYDNLNDVYDGIQALDKSDFHEHYILDQRSMGADALNREIAESILHGQSHIEVEIRDRMLDVAATTDGPSTVKKLKELGVVVDKLVILKNGARLISAEPLVIPKPTPKRPSLGRLQNLNDWIPSPKIRKTLGKMLADQAVHVNELYDAGRYKAAKLAVASTWALWAWYFIQRPVVALIAELVKRAAS